jgi:hypothetical protein
MNVIGSAELTGGCITVTWTSASRTAGVLSFMAYIHLACKYILILYTQPRAGHHRARASGKGWHKPLAVPIDSVRVGYFPSFVPDENGAMPKQQLTVTEILYWAGLFHLEHGRWPDRRDGMIEQADLTWSALSLALQNGYRGLPGGTTLAELLRDRRGVRHKMYPPRLTTKVILRWADAHHRRTGDWPVHDSGAISGVTGETWVAVDAALRIGGRGLPAGSSLARLLEADRGVRNHLSLPPLTTQQILAWADAYHTRTGSWPKRASEKIIGTAGETWLSVDSALLLGTRGLPRGSLARLLAEHRSVRHHHNMPRFSVKQVLAWADAHKTRAQQWPIVSSGSIPESPNDTWAAVNSALTSGRRGFPGRDSLARFLSRHRGKRNPLALPPLKLKTIRSWMQAHHKRTGNWPGQLSGTIPESPGETWNGIGKALERGKRGLSVGMTLARLARVMEASR